MINRKKLEMSKKIEDLTTKARKSLYKFVEEQLQRAGFLWNVDREDILSHLKHKELTWQEDLFKEREELQIKLINLHAFAAGLTFAMMKKEQREQIKEQLEYMTSYENILKRRLNE